MPKSDSLSPDQKVRDKARMQTLGDALARLTKEGELYERLPDNKVRCFACGHRCLVWTAATAFAGCGSTAAARCWCPGYVGALQCDPIEKKPFFHCAARHATPSRSACSAATSTAATARTGSPARCCATRRRARRRADDTPQQLVDLAIQQRAPVIASSYNEPLITSEWAVDVFKEARRAGSTMRLHFQRQRHAQVLDFIRPLGRCLQGRSQDVSTTNTIAQLGGVLENVTEHDPMLKHAASGSRSSPSSCPASATMPTNSSEWPTSWLPSIR